MSTSIQYQPESPSLLSLTLDEMRPELLEKILSLLPQTSDHPELNRFNQLLQDYPRRKGKGIRSELLLASAQVHGVQQNTKAWDQALWLAAGLELFQNWVLIHDDIEDDSEERRGRPALHKMIGIPLAINIGDALHAYMWAAVQAAQLPQGIHEFLNMIHRTAEGQHLDLAWVEHHEWNVQETDYLQMVRLKTAYYTVIYPLRLGALVAKQEPHPLFEPAGLALGTAFQIRDDVLNLSGDPAKYGKEIAGDLLEGKRTLIVLHWLAQAPQEQRQLFLEQMQLDRSAKDPATIAQIHQWLIQSGSLDYAQTYATEQAKEGLNHLRQAFAKVPHPEIAEQVLQTMQALATREA